MINKLYQQTQ